MQSILQILFAYLIIFFKHACRGDILNPTFIGEKVSMKCDQTPTAWATPLGLFRPSDNRFNSTSLSLRYIAQRNNLTITSVLQEDQGKFYCIFGNGNTEEFELYRVYERKNYGKSGWIAVVTSAIFLALCCVIYIASRYQYRDKNASIPPAKIINTISHEDHETSASTETNHISTRNANQNEHQLNDAISITIETIDTAL